MLDFICILLIFFEIIFTVFCVKKLINYENIVNDWHIKMLETAKKVIEINDEIKSTLSKINRVIKIITNKKFHQTRKFLMLSLDIIQVIMFIKTLNLSKGVKSINFKLLKKLAATKISQEVLRKGLDFLQNLCAI